MSVRVGMGLGILSAFGVAMYLVLTTLP